MKKILFFLLLSSSFTGYAQNSINAGMNFQFLEGFITGPTFGYTLSMGEKWSFTPGLFFHLGRYKEKSELRDKIQYYKTDQFVDIKIETLLYGGSISLKRYLGKNSDNETGGFYVIGFLGTGKGKQNLTVPTYDTSLYGYAYCDKLNRSYPSGTDLKSHLKRVIKAGYGFGYDYEIADTFFFFADGALELYSMDVHDTGLYVHIGIRKRFFKL